MKLKLDALYRLPANGINLERTLQCGQSFRWKPIDEGFLGLSAGRILFVAQTEDHLFLDCPSEDIPYWQQYFQASEEYNDFERRLLQTPDLAPVMEVSRGIRVLRQEHFEVLISFIVSANNNVKRIAGFLNHLAEEYGEPLQNIHMGETGYNFPSAQVLANVPEEELRKLGAGYRAPFIISSAKAVCDGFPLAKLSHMSREEAQKKLLTLPGVGPKVADCILLYGYGFGEICPMDVWMKRVIQMLYPNTAEKEAVSAFETSYGRWTGAVQQYYFHYIRQQKSNFRTKKQ